MALSKRTRKNKRVEWRLTLDARKRISLAKLLPNYEISSFKAYSNGNQIILEPMMEIPAQELWLHKNPDAIHSVKKGIQQSKEGKTLKRGSFVKYSDDDI